MEESYRDEVERWLRMEPGRAVRSRLEEEVDRYKEILDANCRHTTDPNVREAFANYELSQTLLKYMEKGVWDE